MGVQALGYLGFEATDIGAWERYATEVLGLMKAQVDGDGVLKLRMDSRSWRIAVQPGTKDDIAYAGFEVADLEAFEAVKRRVADCGVAVTMGNAALLKQRGVIDLFAFDDPCGLRLEVFYGATELFEKPFCSPAAVSGFVTGEQGLGHIVLLMPDAREAQRFYEKALGFRLTDIIDMPIPGGTVELLFMNCNARHHTLALATQPSERKLEHFQLEVASIDDMGLGYDRAMKSGSPIRAGIGRHSNDHMVSFYAFMPSGLAVEYGWGPRTLSRDWKLVRYDTVSIWGHHPVGLH